MAAPAMSAAVPTRADGGQRRRLLRPRRRPVDDDDLGGPGTTEGVDDAARRRAGPDDGDGDPGHAHAGIGQRGDEAVTVGAVTDQRRRLPTARRC